MEFINRNPIIYVISGKAGSGKNVLASILSDLYYKRNKKCIIISYADTLKNYASNILGWDGSEENKPRYFLQQIGVELIKEKIDENFLIDRVIGDIKVYSYFYDVIIISDARFVSEIECLKDFNNVKSIHINSNLENDLTPEQKNHSTENGLNDYDRYDYIVDNSTTIHNLKKQVEDIFAEVENE